MKVFTTEDIKNKIETVISQYSGDNEEDTAVTQFILRFAFSFPGIPEMIVQGVLNVFEHPETAEAEVNSFRYGMSMTCHDENLINACTAVYAEVISDFCGV